MGLYLGNFFIIASKWWFWNFSTLTEILIVIFENSSQIGFALLNVVFSFRKQWGLEYCTSGISDSELDTEEKKTSETEKTDRTSEKWLAIRESNTDIISYGLSTKMERSYKGLEMKINNETADIESGLFGVAMGYTYLDSNKIETNVENMWKPVRTFE